MIIQRSVSINDNKAGNGSKNNKKSFKSKKNTILQNCLYIRRI